MSLIYFLHSSKWILIGNRQPDLWVYYYILCPYFVFWKMFINIETFRRNQKIYKHLSRQDLSFWCTS